MSDDQDQDQQPDVSRLRGTIARILPEKHFAFIYCPDTGKDYFLHESDLEEIPITHLVRGDDVTFVPERAPKGPRAAQVRLVRKTR